MGAEQKVTSVDRIIRFTLRASINGVEPIVNHSGRRRFLPDSLHVEFTINEGGIRRRDVIVSGRGVRVNGSASKRMEHAFFTGVMPEWLAPYAQWPDVVVHGGAWGNV